MLSDPASVRRVITRRLVPVLLSGIVAPAALASCASSAGTQPVTARLHSVGHAHSPTAAALGFDRALQLQRDMPFDCLPGTYEYFSYVGGPHHTETASTTRRGNRWIVTITYDRDSSLTMRYRVRHGANGYCVDRVLGQASRRAGIGPSSPGSGNQDFPPSSVPS